jgi:hypothetical protein
MVEILDDGINGRHRHYLVGALTRDDAIAAVHKALGETVVVNSTSAISAPAFAALNLQMGQVMPLATSR